jgi:N6-L-threonylcarbamoyladenine synthase
MSFAGLKTAVMRVAQALPEATQQDRADLAASFQAAVVDVVADRAANALDMAGGSAARLVVAGGVAANGPLRARLEALAASRSASFFAPPLRYCTDNAAMIALAGAERLAAGLVDGLDAQARPRWPLDAAAAASRPVHLPGRKGAKA